MDFGESWTVRWRHAHLIVESDYSATIDTVRGVFLEAAPISAPSTSI